jgi:hypothetical protein
LVIILPHNENGKSDGTPESHARKDGHQSKGNDDSCVPICASTWAKIQIFTLSPIVSDL